MLVVTTETIQGRQFTEIGLVQGSTIQCKHIGKDIGSAFKNWVGGEMKAYVEMMNEARDIAYERMVAQASQMGADAIVAMHYASAAIEPGAAEVMCYGTAVKFR